MTISPRLSLSPTADQSPSITIELINDDDDNDDDADAEIEEDAVAIDRPSHPSYLIFCERRRKEGTEIEEKKRNRSIEKEIDDKNRVTVSLPLMAIEGSDFIAN